MCLKDSSVVESVSFRCSNCAQALTVTRYSGDDVVMVAECDPQVLRQPGRLPRLVCGRCGQDVPGRLTRLSAALNAEYRTGLLRRYIPKEDGATADFCEAFRTKVARSNGRKTAALVST